jgi:phage shock protein A
MSIWKKLQNIVHQQADTAEKALADTRRDGKYAIEDAKKQLSEFTEKIAAMRAQTNKMKRDLNELELNRDKMDSVSKKAAQAGNRDDARSALEEKAALQKRITVLESQIAQNDNLYKQLLAQREMQTRKVRNADSNLATLAARKDAADMRAAMAKTAEGFGGSDALSVLDDLEAEVEEAEATAEAHEELAGMDCAPQTLAEKYDAGAGDVDAELEALMADEKK